MIRAALASRLQIGQYRMRHLKHCGQIDRQHVRPHLERRLLERRGRGLSRVVDEDIHRAEGVVRKRQRARRGGRVRDVDVRDREARPGAEFGGELLERLRSTSDQRHSRAVGRERAGDRCADAATRAGHKGVTSFQCARRHLLILPIVVIASGAKQSSPPRDASSNVCSARPVVSVSASCRRDARRVEIGERAATGPWIASLRSQ